MPEYSDTEKLEIFKRLFKGREDVFAFRWEKGKKIGYVPAYHYDPYIFRHYSVERLAGRAVDVKWCKSQSNALFTC
ncbi:MAG TPA: hypothetical protein VKZ54_09125 [Membranihabitans sp.]|nr:hypothetical protein [Membranihabitans sp.]